MADHVDDLTRRATPNPLRPPLPDPWRVGRRRRWDCVEDVDERTKAGQGPGIRCSLGRYDRSTGEHVDECGARAAWRVDVICGLCGPRDGYCCELHNSQLPYMIKRGWLHCHATGPRGRVCGGSLVEFIHAERIGW